MNDSLLKVFRIQYFIDPPGGPYETGSLLVEGNVESLDEAHEILIHLFKDWGLKKYTRFGALEFKREKVYAIDWAYWAKRDEKEENDNEYGD